MSAEDQEDASTESLPSAAIMTSLMSKSADLTPTGPDENLLQVDITPYGSSVNSADEESPATPRGTSGNEASSTEDDDELEPELPTQPQSTEDPVSSSSPNEKALIQRKQPLLELVYSEEGYVRRLRFIRENYIPMRPDPKGPPVNSAESGSISPGASCDGGVSAAPTMPDDLAARWRILWGNWIQIYEWHTGFYEKLSSLVGSEPDKIPKLFIDSKARLRSIYSKYCENHRKAALIAEQYRDYLDELRQYLGDKEDVVSHLMQPVQRIMRYQLPMAEIVKYTERAQAPDLSLWEKAFEIMKEIPKNTQLILEAARIDGFPGVITTLGNILIRGDLLVASISREQLLETVASYKLALQEICQAFHTREPLSLSQIPSTTVISIQPSTPTSNITPTLGESFNLTNSDGNASSASLYCGSMKFVESRLFLFEQMLVITEEIRPKRRTTSSDAFAQSTYQFRAGINVNKMRYESHWYNCSLPNGHTNADAAAVDQLLNTGLTPDDLRFAILDQRPGCDVVYVIDPITTSNRGLWVVHLRDIQRMQQEFLLALQDPRRFNTGTRDDDSDIPDCSSHPLDASEAPVPVVRMKTCSQQQQQQQQRSRKWPSFTMKRPGRLGSTSSACATSIIAVGKQPSLGSSSSKHAHPPLPPTSTGSSHSMDPSYLIEVKQKAKSWARSVSAERSRLADVSGGGSGAVGDCDGEGWQKRSSLSANNSIKSTGPPRKSDFMTGSISPDSNNINKNSSAKRRSRFAGLFSRNKSKSRSKQQPYQQTTSPSDVQKELPTTQASLLPPSGARLGGTVEETVKAKSTNNPNDNGDNASSPQSCDRPDCSPIGDPAPNLPAP